MTKGSRSCKSVGRPGLIGALACALGLALGPGLAAAQAPAEASVSFNARFSYSAKFLCGKASEAFQEGVVQGAYQTALNLHNPSPDGLALVRVHISRAYPYQRPADSSQLPAVSLPPLASIEIECDQIRGALASPQTAEFRSGYATMFASQELTVTAVYSARPRSQEVSTIDTVRVAARRLCGTGELRPDGSCRCPRGLIGRQCNVSVAKISGPTFLRLKWVGLDEPGDIVRSDNDCLDLEVENLTDQNLFAEVEFYGTLNGNAKGMTSPLSSIALGSNEVGTINRCLRDFEGGGGHSDLIDLAFSATINARATVFDGNDNDGDRLDRIFAPTGYFHVDPDPALFFPYRAVLYGLVARRETFAGGDYAGRFGFTLPPGGIFVGDTHPDELYDEGGPDTDTVIVPVP